jgi:hypothetical protein
MLINQHIIIIMLIVLLYFLTLNAPVVNLTNQLFDIDLYKNFQFY